MNVFSLKVNELADWQNNLSTGLIRNISTDSLQESKTLFNAL